MSTKHHIVTLPAEERQYLENYMKTGVHRSRAMIRARVLLLADKDESDPAIAREVGVCKATVFNIRRRYCAEGLQATLDDKPRSGKPRTMTERKVAQVSALACSKPPEGRQRWTHRLLADRLVELAFVESVSHTTVGRVLKKTRSNLGKSDSGVFARSLVGS